MTEYLELGRLVGKGFGTKAASKPRPRRGLSVCTHNVGTEHYIPMHTRRVVEEKYLARGDMISCVWQVLTFFVGGRVVEMSNSEISFAELMTYSPLCWVF